MTSLPIDSYHPTLLKKTDYTSKKIVELTTQQKLQYSFININKPKGPTSHQVADHVKKLLVQHTGINKVGHGGTLDPAVTGVLPVGLGHAVKTIRTFLHAGKEYVCYMKLHELLDEQKIREAAQAFIGPIKQTPPKKSAVKRVERTRTIYYLDILEIDGQDVLFKVGCQAGTYIRTLCIDIGTRLGCGAHMQQLVRTRSAGFDWQHCITLQEFNDALVAHTQGNDLLLQNILIPVEQATSHIPKIYVTDEAAESMLTGAVLGAPGVVQCEDTVQANKLALAMTVNDQAIALVVAQQNAKDILAAQNGLVATLERVLMPREWFANNESPTSSL